MKFNTKTNRKLKIRTNISLPRTRICILTYVSVVAWYGRELRMGRFPWLEDESRILVGPIRHHTSVLCSDSLLSEPCSPIPSLVQLRDPTDSDIPTDMCWMIQRSAAGVARRWRGLVVAAMVDDVPVQTLFRHTTAIRTTNNNVIRPRWIY